LLPGIGLSLVSVFLKYLPQFFSFSWSYGADYNHVGWLIDW
jgi:hypothetical protein